MNSGKTSLRITSIRDLLVKERRKIKLEEFKISTNNGIIYLLMKALPPMMFDEYTNPNRQKQQ